MKFVGNSALLVKISGRFSRLTTAICVSHLVERMAMARNSDDSPRHIRNNAAKATNK